MSVDAIVQALRNAVAIDKDGINCIADQLEQLRAENERLKASEPVICGECIYSSWAKGKEADSCPMNLFRLARDFGNTDVNSTDYCSYGKRRETE